MTGDASEVGDDLVTMTAAAAVVGISLSVLARQVKAGLIRSHRGRVRVSEVLEDRAKNIDLSRGHRRKYGSPQAAQSSAAPVVEVDGQLLSYGDAKALKENYLAKLRRLEFEVKSGELVEVDVVGEVFERECATIRERLLVIPGKVASRVVGLAIADVERIIQAEISEALEELHAPNFDPPAPVVQE